MKFIARFLLILGILAISGKDVCAKDWHTVVGQALDIAINAEGQGYIASPDGVHRWDKVEQRWRTISGHFVRIAAAEGNRPWAINKDGTLYRFNGLWWEDKDKGVADVAANAKGDVYIAKRDGKIKKWYPLRNEWLAVDSPVPVGRLTLNEGGELWVIAQDASLHHYDGRGWQLLPGRARDIAIGGTDTVAIVDYEGYLRRWNGLEKGWKTVPGIQNIRTVALTPEGAFWTVSKDGTIRADGILGVQELQEKQKIKKEKKDKDKGLKASSLNPAPATVTNIQAGNLASSALVATTLAPAPAAAKESKTGNIADSINPATTTTTAKITFVNTRKNASSLAIGGDGSVFGLDAGGNVLRWSNKYKRFDEFPGTVVRLSVDKDGNPWGVSALGRVFKHDGERWVQIQGITATDISIGYDGTVLIVNASNQIARFNETLNRFDLLKATNVASVAAGPDGTPWAIRTDKLVERCDQTPCKVLRQKAQSLSVGPDGSVWIVSNLDTLMRLKKGKDMFERILTPGHTPKKVAVGPKGYPWVLSDANLALASHFFDRNETGDNIIAAKTLEADTIGTGDTTSVTTSATTSNFTFSKNMQFDEVTDAGFASEYNPILESDPNGVIWAYNYNADTNAYSQFQYYDEDRRKFVAVNTTIDSYLNSDIAVESEDLIWAVRASDEVLFREKNGSVKEYTVSSDQSAFRGLDIGGDGTLYVALTVSDGDTHRYLYTKVPDSHVFKKFSTYNTVRDVAVGPGADIWILGESYKVMRWTGSKYEEPGRATFYAADIAIGKIDGTVYVRKNGTNDLYKWNETNKDFDKINNITVETFAVDGEGRPWICCGDDSSNPTVSKARD